MLELSYKDFKTGMITMLQKVSQDSLETNGKIEILGRKGIKYTKEPKGKF